MRLRVVERAVHAAAPRRPHHQRHLEVTVRPVVELGRLAHQLVEGGVDEVGELDLRDRAEAGERQPDPDADDGRLGERRVDHALVAELRVQPVGRAEHAAARPDVLAQDQHPLVRRQELVLHLAHGVDDGSLGAAGRLR